MVLLFVLGVPAFWLSMGLLSTGDYAFAAMWGLICFVLFSLSLALNVIIERSDHDATACTSCGYDLRALVSEHCPECGTDVFTFGGKPPNQSPQVPGRPLRDQLH